MSDKTEKFKESVEQHWKWVEGLLNVTVLKDMDFDEMMRLCHYLYITAMIHGYKHGIEENG